MVQRRKWHPTPVLLPGKSHGRRSLVGYSPWGREESDMTKRLHSHFSLSCIGEGNGNPLQRSCLKNPRDRGAWWAAVYGVAQSQTRLKWLSSSSSTLWWNKLDDKALFFQRHVACLALSLQSCTCAFQMVFSFFPVWQVGRRVEKRGKGEIQRKEKNERDIDDREK